MNLEINNKKFEFRGFDYSIESVENIDGFYYHINTNKNIFCFDLDVTINGIKFNTIDEVINYING
jgi:hypothetical protein